MTDKIRCSELAAELRILADRLDAADLPDGEVKIEITNYCCSDRERLAKWVRLIDRPAAKHNRGYHWVEGLFGKARLTVHYTAGLLSSTRKKKFVEREYEVKPDLQTLLAVS